MNGDVLHSDVGLSVLPPRRNIRRFAGTLGIIFLAAGCVTAIEPSSPQFSPGERFLPISDSSELDLADVTDAAQLAMGAAMDTTIANSTSGAARPQNVEPARAASYSVLPNVEISKDVEQKLAKVADIYHRRTGKPLVITSGTRGPEAQARAMFRLLSLGTDVVGLYKNKPAAREIQAIYLRGKSRHEGDPTIVRAMTASIRRQMSRGVFISAHLRAGAVDVRNRNMTMAERRAFKSCVSHAGGISLLEESKPPHFHLQVQ